MKKRLYITGDIPGIGGVIKRHPEDFLVEEVPLYEPRGEGRHTYLTVEKRGISTFEAAYRLASHFGVSPHGVGYAGLKDSRAVAIQRMSIEDVEIESAIGLELPGLRVLDAALHSNKLRLGHLAGNRFTIRVREPGPNAFESARAVLEHLAEKGVPNFFGMQRFSGRRNSHRIGRALLLGEWEEAIAEYLGRPQEHDRAGDARQAFEEGDYDRARRLFPMPRFRNERRVLAALLRGRSPEEALQEMSGRLRRLFTSAYQSLLFNRVLARRLPDIGTLLDGDIAMKHRGGAAFLVESAEIEQPRADALEISPSGPLFGGKMLRPEGLPREAEDRVLHEEGFDPKRMEAVFHAVNGGRRPLRIPLMEISLREEEDGDLVVSFRLPSGSYATVVMDELMKRDQIDLFEDDPLDADGDEAGTLSEPSPVNSSDCR